MNLNPSNDSDRECDFLEHCWTLIGWYKQPLWYATLAQKVTGKPTTVDFDGPWALDREEQHGDVVGFLHTHPSGSCEPSVRDLKTMRAWVSCFGKPLLCLIQTDEAVTAYLFHDDECQGEELEMTQRLSPNSLVVFQTPKSKMEDHDE